MDSGLKVKISKRVDTIIRRMKTKNDGKEFYMHILAPEKDPFYFKDFIVPKQKVSSATVDIELVDGKSQYQETVTKYLKENIEVNGEKLVCVGTFHIHPITGFSSTDDDDLKNNYSINTTEGLPFIDIVLQSNDEYACRVVIKLNKGMTKQFIVVEGNIEIADDCVDSEDVGDIYMKYKDKYNIDYGQLMMAFKPNITDEEIEKYMENIKTKTFYTNKKGLDEFNVIKSKKDNEVGIHCEFHKKNKILYITFKNCDEDIINDMIDDWIIASEIDATLISQKRTKNSFTYGYEVKNRTDADKLELSLEDSFAVWLDVMLDEELDDMANKEYPNISHGFYYRGENDW